MKELSLLWSAQLNLSWWLLFFRIELFSFELLEWLFLWMDSIKLSAGVGRKLMILFWSDSREIDMFNGLTGVFWIYFSWRLTLLSFKSGLLRVYFSVWSKLDCCALFANEIFLLPYLASEALIRGIYWLNGAIFEVIRGTLVVGLMYLLMLSELSVSKSKLFSSSILAYGRFYRLSFWLSSLILCLMELLCILDLLSMTSDSAMLLSSLWLLILISWSS